MKPPQRRKETCLSPASVERHAADSVLELLKLYAVELARGDVAETLFPAEVITDLRLAVALDLRNV